MKAFRQWLALLCFLVLCWLSDSAWADGKVFARAIVSPTTPDQRAMLHFSNGVERLVIETSFVGEGTNFAWVIPLPSEPKIEAVSSNFFGYLSLAFQPEVHYQASPAWLFIALFGGMLSVAIWLRRTKEPSGCFTWLLFCVFVLLFAALAMPSFVRSRGTTSVAAENTVRLLNQQTVGLFDTVTLSSPDGRTLLDWLNTHGFNTPASALPVISSYATQGWVFVAATLNRDAAPRERSQLHPLAFTFQSQQAVYPLRLTGVENDRCSVELFVFGPARAEANGFQVEHCGPPLWQPENDLAPGLLPREWFDLPKPGAFYVGRPELLDFGKPADVVTKLTGTLTREAMQRDAEIRWVPFRAEHPVLYTQAAVVTAALNRMAMVLVPGLLVIQILRPRLTPRRSIWGFLFVVLVGSACALARLGTARITEVEFIRGGWTAAAHNFRQLDGALQQYWLEWDSKKDPVPSGFEQFSSDLGTYLKGGKPWNTFTGTQLKNEPTPGNLTLNSTTNGVDVFWYDIAGGAHWMVTFTNSPANRPSP